MDEFPVGVLPLTLLFREVVRFCGEPEGSVLLWKRSEFQMLHRDAFVDELL